MATINATANLSPGLIFTAGPQSLFDLLQNFMDMEQWDANTRTDALSALTAYHAATIANDKITGQHAINRIHKDSTMLLDYFYGIYSGVYGVWTMPVDRPAAPQLSEIVKQVAATRAARGLNALKVTQ